ncbi:hypothetical protein As57867_007159, partial [Aphanomyces stellatus]
TWRGQAVSVVGSWAGVQDKLPSDDQLFWYNTDTNLLQNAMTNECLDAYATPDGNFHIHTFACGSGNVNQKWKVDTVARRVYHLNHDRCLDANPADGNQLSLHLCDSSSANWNQWLSLERRGQCMAKERDINFEGQELINFDAASADDCCATCQDHAACHAYSFSNNRCYLKKARALKGNGVWPGTTSARVYKCAPLQKGVDFTGNDLGSVPAPAAEDCCAYCRLNVECMAFTYAYGTCYLKSGVTVSLSVNANAWSAAIM